MVPPDLLWQTQRSHYGNCMVMHIATAPSTPRSPCRRSSLGLRTLSLGWIAATSCSCAGASMASANLHMPANLSTEAGLRVCVDELPSTALLGPKRADPRRRPQRRAAAERCVASRTSLLECGGGHAQRHVMGPLGTHGARGGATRGLRRRQRGVDGRDARARTKLLVFAPQPHRFLKGWLP